MKKYFAVALMIALRVLGQEPAATAPAINIILKDGRTVTTTQALERSGNDVMVTVPMGGNQQGQMGYDVSTIARIEFPEPAQIQAAIDLLAAGQTDQGIAELEPVLTYYGQFRDVPGSWWSKAAVLKINALINSGRDNDAAPLVAELSECQGDPEAVCAAKVQEAAAMARSGGYEAALESLDEAIAQTQNKDTLAQAWLYKGDSLLALRRWEPAITAYLHVPVFYFDAKVLVPQAMLGGARAMIGLQDLKSAKDELEDLVKNYPSSPQANTAATELDKIEKDQNQNQ
jgi:tetratricopeptide (TPR) repeat protein